MADTDLADILHERFPRGFENGYPLRRQSSTCGFRRIVTLDGLASDDNAVGSLQRRCDGTRAVVARQALDVERFASSEILGLAIDGLPVFLGGLELRRHANNLRHKARTPILRPIRSIICQGWVRYRASMAT